MKSSSPHLLPLKGQQLPSNLKQFARSESGTSLNDFASTDEDLTETMYDATEDGDDNENEDIELELDIIGDYGDDDADDTGNMPTAAIFDVDDYSGGDCENDDNKDDDDDDDDDDDEEEVTAPACAPQPGFVILRPSLFNGLPATIFVEYPPELGIKREDDHLVEPLGDRKIAYKSYWERICIKNAFARAGFKKSEKYWTALWSKHQNEAQMKELNCLQKINHFPASWCIGRKDRLSRTMNMMKRTHGSSFDFHPETFHSPRRKGWV